MFNNPQKYITRNDIKEIKKKFDWIVIHSVNSKIPGVTLDQALQMIAQQIDSSPHIFQKWIKRSSRKLIASWQQILEIIEEYNQQQETVFDNQIYEQSSFQFTEDKFIQMKPSYFQVAKPLEKQIYIYFIENMSYLKWKQEFLILIFNNKTLALMNLHTFKPQLVISVKAIEKTKKKQSDNYMSILQRLDQQQSKDGWKKQINFYKKNNESVYERIETSSSIKEKFDPIDQCKKDIEYLQKVVNLNPWDPELRPLNPDPKMQLIRKRGQSEHQKRYQNYESENYKATSALQVQLLASKNNYIVLILENLIIQFYQLDYDYKNSDYSLNKKHEFTLNDKIDQVAIVENRWTKEIHCLFFKQKWLLVFLIPEFKQIDKISINQQADTMHSNKILIVCQYDGLFSIIKENIRTTLQEQLYSVSIQKKVKYNDLKQSVQSLDYSHKYQLIIFGSMCTLVSIFDLRQNAFIYQFSILNSMQQCNQLNDKILRIFVYDSQNQYIVLFVSGYVSIWDLQRHKKVQEFVKQLPQSKNQQQYYSGLFLEHRAQLLIGGYNLQSWTSKINPIQLYDNYIDSNSSPVYT